MREREKKRLLVLFIQSHVGGAMTALVNFVNALDTDRYDVDLMFYEMKESVGGIKPEIHILPQGKQGGGMLKRLLCPAYVAAFAHAQYLRRVRRNPLLAVQRIAKQGCRFSRRLNKTYDIAVAFELNWPFDYMMRFVHARRKLVWHHNDYHGIGYCFRWDKPFFDRVDAMAFVSRECMKKFVTLHPEYDGRCFFMPNIMAKAPLLARAAESVELPFVPVHPGVSFVTVARVEFATKGLDRMIPVLCRLREEGLIDRVRWLIIGDGSDMPRLKQMIEASGLQEVVWPIGLRENPLPYLRLVDAFLLPSRNEGRPVVITEAQVLGLVPVVTHYASAPEQIEHGVDGFILENDDESLYEGVRDIVLHPEKLEAARAVVRSRSYTNERDIACFDEVVDRLDSAPAQ